MNRFIRETSDKKPECRALREVEVEVEGLGRGIGERGAAPRGVVRLLHHTRKDELRGLRRFTNGQLAPVVASDQDDDKRKDDDISQCCLFFYGIVDF